MPAQSSEPVDVPIRDESIRLGQFLKLANLVESGAEAKPVIADGAVTVNGEVETRRGRQLTVGDVVTLGGLAARVAEQRADRLAGPAAGEVPEGDVDRGERVVTLDAGTSSGVRKDMTVLNNDGLVGRVMPQFQIFFVASPLMVVASKSHRDQATDDYIGKYAVKDMKSAGSSLKFCLVATGEADLYPRLGRTMEWDTAAGDAVAPASENGRARGAPAFMVASVASDALS